MTAASDMYDMWMRAWNGEQELVDAIFATTCVVHQAGNEGMGRAHVRAMIEQGRAPFAPVHFRIQVPPIVEADRLAARWTCTGEYRGGMPGASAPEGTVVTFGGIDIWRIEDGRVVEYWTSSDGLALMEQLTPS